MISAFYLFSDCYYAKEMPPVNSNKRKALTAAEKLNLLTAIENKGVRTLTDLSIELGVPRTTLSTIWANKTSISRVAEETNAKTRKKNKIKVIISQSIKLYLCGSRRNVSRMCHSILMFGRPKRKNFRGISISKDGFARTVGYQGGERDMELRAKVISGESNTVNLSTVDRWKETELKKIFDDYPAENVFNADETGVFWRLFPERTFCLPGKSRHDGQKSKEHVTVMICVSSHGSEKRPLLIIGKVARPRCFKKKPSIERSTPIRKMLG